MSTQITDEMVEAAYHALVAYPAMTPDKTALRKALAAALHSTAKDPEEGDDGN